MPWTDLQRDILEDIVSVAPFIPDGNTFSFFGLTPKDYYNTPSVTRIRLSKRQNIGRFRRDLTLLAPSRETWTTAELAASLGLQDEKKTQTLIGLVMRELGWIGKQTRPKGPGARKALAKTVFYKLKVV